MNDTINKKTTGSFFQEISTRIKQAKEMFIKRTSSVRLDIVQTPQTAKEFFDRAGDAGLAFLVFSNNSVASNNELELISELTPQETLFLMGAVANIKVGKEVNDRLPPLSDKIKLLAQSHVTSEKINALSESPYSAGLIYDFTVSGTNINIIIPEPEPEDE